MCSSHLHILHLRLYTFLPFLEVTCPLFNDGETFSGGIYFPPQTEFRFQEVVYFFCYPEFELLGSSPKLVCEANGMWDFAIPHCIRKFSISVIIV